MASVTSKMFSDFNGETVAITRWDLMNNKIFAETFPGVKGCKYDRYGLDKFVGKHPVTGAIIPVTRNISYSLHPSKHKCDNRCMNAKGHNCECICGGENHGKGFSCK